MKTLALSLLLSLFLVGGVQAEAESPQAICSAEAEDAGFENAGEKQAYIDDCIQQVTQEMSENPSAEEAPVSEES